MEKTVIFLVIICLISATALAGTLVFFWFFLSDKSKAREEVGFDLHYTVEGKWCATVAIRTITGKRAQVKEFLGETLPRNNVREVLVDVGRFYPEGSYGRKTDWLATKTVHFSNLFLKEK